MKKNFIIALCALGMSMIVPTQKAFAKEVTDNLEKFELGIAVQKLYDFIWDIFCDWYIELAKIRLQQGGERAENAKRVLVWVLGNWRNVIISDEFLYNIENELLTDIDVEMIENHNFEGKKTKKVLVTEGNNQIVLFFVANWEQGDSDGNGIITIKVYDITDQIPTLY